MIKIVTVTLIEKNGLRHYISIKKTLPMWLAANIAKSIL